MHFATVFTLAAVVLSASASLLARQTAPPSCATSCLSNPTLNGCGAQDLHCLCTNAASVNATTTCLQAACTVPSDLQAALQFSQGLCASVGVTFTASGTSAPASATATASASAATSPASSSSSAATTPSKAAAVTTRSTNTFVGIAAVGLVALAL